MRSRWLTAALLLVWVASSSAAEEAKHDHAAMAAKAKTTKITTPVQKTCPVTGEPIRENVSVEQDGTKVYFCCPACIAKFKKSPMKYLPAVYRQDYPQSVQVKCPVMGGPVDGKTFTEYQGRQVGFCCSGCTEEFKSDPEKYMAKLKDLSTEQVHDPVTGKAINPKLSAEYKGKTVYFSSEDARTRFEADPAKYASTLSPEAGVVARGPTAGDDLILTLADKGDSAVLKRKDLKTTSYEGKTYFVRGDEGVKAFQADPARYAKALDKAMAKHQGDSSRAYTCSMHPDVLQKGPGKCPKCGMKLTPVKNTDAGRGAVENSR